MKYPKTDPKSYLTLSEAPKVDRRIARASAATIVLALVACVFGSGSASAAPTQCLYCLSGAPTDSPTATTLVKIIHRSAPPTQPSSLPPTDTDR